MENNNRGQNGQNRQNNEGGIMNKIGQTIENAVDAITGGNGKNQQRGRNNNNR